MMRAEFIWLLLRIACTDGTVLEYCRGDGPVAEPFPTEQACERAKAEAGTKPGERLVCERRPG